MSALIVIVEKKGQRGSCRLFLKNPGRNYDAGDKVLRLLDQYGTIERAFCYVQERIRLAEPESLALNHWQAVAGILRRLNAGAIFGDHRRKRPSRHVQSLR